MAKISINSRIREIRDIEGLGRKAFADLLGTNRQRIENIEREAQRVQSDIIEAIAEQWPQYAYWLISGKEIPEAGQVSPQTEKTRRESKTA